MNESIQHKLEEIFLSKLGIEHPDTNSDMEELGVDSLGIVELAIGIKKELGVDIDENLNMNIKFGEILNTLSEKLYSV